VSSLNLRRTALLKRRRAIFKAQEDMIDFARYVRPTPDDVDDVTRSIYEPVKHHRVIAAALEQVEQGKIKRLIISCPPRHGKSELASRLFPAWFVGRNPTDNMILATYNETLSADFGRNVRDILQSPLYQQVFPDAVLKDGAASVDRVELEKGATLFFTGRGGSLTGRGARLILVDDPLKDRKEADSPTIRDQLWAWFNQVLSTRLMTKDGAIVIIMTRWHEDDVIGRLTDPTSPYYNAEEAKKWRIIDLPAIAGDNDVLGRAEGEVLWPGRFDREYFDSIRRTDPRGFQALYQGRPTPDDGAFFKAESILTYNRMSDMPPKEKMRFYGASDHAVSQAQDRDKTCLMVVGVDEHDNIWVQPDIYWGRGSTDQVVEVWLAMMEKYRPQFWWAERGHITKSIGPFLRKRMIERGVYCAIDEVVPVGDKQTRAQSIHARMSMGKVRLPQFSRWFPDARDELLKFPQGVHDDFVDTLALVGFGLNKQAPRRIVKPVNSSAKTGTFGWIKEDSRRRDADLRASIESGGW
jgi:predicted phage terminase large subunit-like protein